MREIKLKINCNSVKRKYFQQIAAPATVTPYRLKQEAIFTLLVQSATKTLHQIFK